MVHGSVCEEAKAATASLLPTNNAWEATVFLIEAATHDLQWKLS